APRGRGGRAGPDARAAAVRRAGQRAAARGRRPDRAGRPGRRGYGGRACPGAAPHVTRGAAGLRGAGPAHRRPRAGRWHPHRRRRPAAARRAGRGPAMMPVVARTRLGLAAARRGLSHPIVLVPTMGALHEGHQALLRRARDIASPDGSVVVSIFVNPLQFGAGEDLDRYPRTMPADVLACAEEGADLIFAPGQAEMYPRAPLVTVDPGPMGQMLEGESRPGHFAGVLTVVLKLFHLVRPDVAVFGEKDAQQLALVRRMVADLDVGVRIVAGPTVRDPDGLAVSSRNKFLSGPE